MTKMINDGKMLQTLRHTNYNAVTAAADIVDNSLDAGADKVEIDIENAGRSLQRVLFADNGIGMTRAELTEAFKIGSERKYDGQEDLGCFGVGLITASINQGKRLTVISKKNGRYSFGQLDVDKVVAADEYHINQRAATEEEKDELDSYIEEESGTLVIWDKLDRCTYKYGEAFVRNLKNHFAITFRQLIRNNKVKMRIDGKILKAVDPIRDFNNTEILKREVQLSEGVSIKIRMNFIETLKRGNKDDNLKLYAKDCGFSVLRNGREISRSADLGLFKRVTELRRFRGTIELSADADKIIKTDFQKTNIEFNEEDREILSGIIEEGLAGFRRLNDEYMIILKEEKEAQRLEEEKKVKAEQEAKETQSSVLNAGFDPKPEAPGINDAFLNKLNLLLEEFNLQGKYEEFKAVYKK